MTTARWTSFIIGCLYFPLHYSNDPNPSNIWDFLIVLTYKAASAALIIVPLLLEYKEHQKSKKGD